MTVALVGCLLVILALLVDRHVTAAAHARQLAELCQRIQAPEAAIIEHQQRVVAEPLPVLEWDNDEQYHATREDLAEALKPR